MRSIAIVIPTLNEERAVGEVLDRIPVLDLLRDGFETTPYVVDGHSKDATREIAERKGARIIFDEGRGKGAAIRTAFSAIDADYLIMVDGDDTYPLEVAREMVQRLQTHDVVVGSRLKGTIEPGAMTRVNVVGNKLLTLLAQVLFRANISDLCTGLWGFRSDAVRRLELAASGFELEADLFAECMFKGCRIAEIPITYRARQDRPKLASLKDGWKIGLHLIRKWRISGRIAPSGKRAVSSARIVRGADTDEAQP